MGSANEGGGAPELPSLKLIQICSCAFYYDNDERRPRQRFRKRFESKCEKKGQIKETNVPAAHLLIYIKDFITLTK